MNPGFWKSPLTRLVVETGKPIRLLKHYRFVCFRWFNYTTFRIHLGTDPEALDRSVILFLPSQKLLYVASAKEERLQENSG
jgi:hypothetical protein